MLGVELEVQVHRDVGQRSVCQRKIGIDFDGLRQALDGSLQDFRLTSVALAKTGHELVVGLRVVAVSVTRRRRRRWEASPERLHHPPPDFILDVEDVFYREVMFLGNNALLCCRVEKADREPPLYSQLLHVSLKNVADPQITAHLRSVGTGRVLQDTRCWCDY